MSPSHWKSEFSRPMVLSDGAAIVTLEDARVFLVDMRWREAQQPEWRAAMRAVLAAEKSGDLTEAESAITHALTVNGLIEQADQ